MDKTLSNIYLDPSQPASFGGLDAVYRAVKEKGRSKISLKQFQDWLSLQDQGSEFLNHVFQQFLRESNLDFFTVNSVLKAIVVERFNRTFENKMYKYSTSKNTLTYVDELPKLVKSFNNTYHRSIKMKPSQVTKANEAKVWETLYGNDVDKRVRFKFQVGDRIRTWKVKRIFEKSYLPNFKNEFFLLSPNDLRVKYLPINWKMMLERA